MHFSGTAAIDPFNIVKFPLDPQHPMNGGRHGARTSSPFCSRGGAARAAGVGLPLVYRRDDLGHRYRISLVDMVMGEHMRRPTGLPM